MDFQFWLIVIIAVISLISRLGKKKGETTEQEPGPQRTQGNRPPVASERPRQMTFEELLREITEAKQKPATTYTPPVQSVPQRRVPEIVDYEEDIEEEEQKIEVVQKATRREEENRRKRFQTEYDEAKRQAFTRASLEETLSIRDTEVKFGKFGVFEEQQQRNLLEEYTKDLRSPDGLKKAFVLSEILNRKF